MIQKQKGCNDIFWREAKLFYVYGHSYEFDYEDGKGWEKMEEFCKIISGRDDIFYGTNREVLL